MLTGVKLKLFTYWFFLLFLVSIIEIKFFFSTFLFFGIPAIYLLYLKPNNFRRVFMGTVLGSIFGLSFELLAELSNAWTWPPQKMALSGRLFDIIPSDVVVFYFIWLFFTLMFYEYFFEKDRSTALSPRFKYGLAIFVSLLVATSFIAAILPSLFRINYSYLLIGIIAMIPFIYLIFKKPKLSAKLFGVSIFTSILFFAFEIISLSLGHWEFNGDYLGIIPVASFLIPFEEFFFWIILGGTLVLSFYELLVDDIK